MTRLYRKCLDCSGRAATGPGGCPACGDVGYVGAGIIAEEAYRALVDVKHIKAAVQLHHDQCGDDRCYMDDLKLYHDVLGIGFDPYVTALPPDADMDESCRRYRRQRQHPDVAGTYPTPDGMTIQQLTDELLRIRAELAVVKSERDQAVGRCQGMMDEVQRARYNGMYTDRR